MIDIRLTSVVVAVICLAFAASSVRADYDYENGNRCDPSLDDDLSHHRKAYMTPSDRPQGGIQAEVFFDVVCPIPRKRVYESIANGETTLQVAVLAYGTGGGIECSLDVTSTNGRALVEPVEASATLQGNDTWFWLPTVELSGLPWYASYSLRCAATADGHDEHRVYGYYWRTSEPNSP